MRLGILVVLAVVVLAGCVQSGATGPAALGVIRLPGDDLAFSPTKIIDPVRAGGEPVIQVTQKGTILVAAHPGYTHTRYPPSPGLVTSTTGQSYLWRSTDQGETWKPIGLPNANGAGPRGLGQGVSDPDLAMDSSGRIYLTDLEGLAAASVSWSDDDGQTWLVGNDIASTYGPVDRNWIATHGKDVYFMGNYLASRSESVLKSSDGGITWTLMGAAHCEGDINTRADGAIIVGCGGALDISTDGGKTFKLIEVPGGKAQRGELGQAAADAAGNVYEAWADGGKVYVAATRDDGATWTQPILLSNGTGTAMWPWPVAGDDGRVGVAWYATDATPQGSTRPSGDWFVQAAIVTDALGAPQVTHARVTDAPIFHGAICKGTQCQLDPSPNGDRRLGDFFEATADAEGHLLISYSVVGSDSISHPGFSRQVAGPLLRE